MENSQCKIVLDKPTNTYYSGQSIFGTITLLKYNGKKIRGKFLELVFCCGLKIAFYWFNERQLRPSIIQLGFL